MNVAVAVTVCSSVLQYATPGTESPEYVRAQ